ncbi:hypothetical protein [Taibaiella sp. KBW10]|uniref:hypothetical protein n=1 Tax=Taibaiella sp. KBW10 TaxID=2153357 RepID=UPI000F593478|nr:hypothetical protein [Taibaiella sp. KBW10]
MLRKYNKQYIAIMGIILAFCMIALPWFIQPEMRELKYNIRLVGFSVLGVFYILFVYYNRTQWKRFVLRTFVAAILYFVVMWLSKPMMDAPYKYQPAHNTPVETP